MTIIIFSSLFDINDKVFIHHIIIMSDKFRVKFRFDGFLEIILVWFSLNAMFTLFHEKEVTCASHLIYNTRHPKIYTYICAHCPLHRYPLELRRLCIFILEVSFSLPFHTFLICRFKTSKWKFSTIRSKALLHSGMNVFDRF